MKTKTINLVFFLEIKVGNIYNNYGEIIAIYILKEYQGQGYFSKLFKYMIEDLKRKGYKRVTLGVETTEIKNKQIYNKYGFNNYIKADKETYPDGHEIEVEYYSKQL